MNSKKLVIVAGLMLGSSWALGATYKIDTSHSEVGFGVTHLMISKVKGRFQKFEGGFEFDEKKAELKGLDVKIDVASINTDDKKRDEHLTGDDFFSAKNHPQISFKSDKAELKGGAGKVNGTLTIKGVSKPVTLAVEYKGPVTDPWGNEKFGFSATTKINRKDFGVSWNQKLDKGGVAVSEDVTITIEGEAVKDAPVKK